MFNTIIFSISNLLLAILLLIVYIFKVKEKNINNILYNSLLICLIVILVTEIVSVYTIYNNQLFPLLNEVICRIRGVGIIIWAMLISLYLISLSTNHNYEEFKKVLHKNYYILPIYLLIIVCFFFFKYDYVILNDTAYLKGSASIYIFMCIILISLFCIIFIPDSIFSKYSKKMIALFLLLELIVILMLSYTLPYVYFATTVLTLNTYILYFVTENPDLYAIKQLEKANDIIENLNTSKIDFFNNITNEIRSSVQSIVNLSDILLESPYDREKILPDVNSIFYTGNNLNAIITNVLDISKIDYDLDCLNEEEYDLKSLILDLMVMFEEMNNKNINLNIICDENVPRRYIGDRNKIYKILLNLLDNSIKYTYTGRVSLKIECLVKDKNCLLKFCVSDTGVGLKENEYNKVLNELSDLDKHTYNGKEYVGPGLIIVKKFVDIMNGKIIFTSDYGAGTKFYVELPQKIVDNTVIGTINMENVIDYKNYSSLKVLIVDNGNLDLKLMKTFLNPYKFSVDTSLSVKDFIYKIKQGNRYALIFIDQMMLKEDDIELIEVLEKLSDIFVIPPIIVLTSDYFMLQHDKKKFICDSLMKPINNIKLDEIITKYLDK